MLKKLLFFLFLSIALAGCKKNPDDVDAIVVKPSISTNPATDLTSSTVVCGGTITNNGPVNVLVSGLCWSTAANPNITNLRTAGSTTIGTFSDNLVGLTPNTTYYIKAYLTTLSDTIYGSQVAITTPQKHIYIAGFEINSSNRYIARYWKNGVAIVLTNGTQDAEASSIHAFGNDVYVAGYESNGTKRIAKFWKNGVATNLSNGTTDAAANAVLVNNNNLYVAGYETNGSNKKVAKLWKNGVAQNITNGNFDAQIAAIAVKNDKVYLTGYESDGAAGARGKYWVDGVPTVVNSANTQGFGSGIALSGNDVYVAGTISPGFASNYVMLWKNGQQVAIDQGNFFYGVGTGVSVFGNDVHVCGSTNDSGASWWKNGAGTSLTGNYNSKAKAIQVVGGIVYIAGAIITSGGNTLPAYWVDRVLVSLPYTALYSTTTAIFVQ